jgi:ubiquinone/menaquinone biosynthesis C-methylase UbiE
MDSIIAPPARELMYDGPADAWEANGREFLEHYEGLCSLKPHERMLDVGCGIGRKTLPLLGYLTPPGSYEGFDCNYLGVRWCQENISPRYPNFRFQHVDVYAPGYNPSGQINPAGFHFPYQNNEFDFVMLGSVFTHLGHGGVKNYLGEIQRVLKPGGRCLITYFLRSAYETAHAMFPYPCLGGWCQDGKFPEKAIAYDEGHIRTLYQDAGLDIDGVFYGSWSGSKGLSYQDMILAYKRDDS